MTAMRAFCLLLLTTLASSAVVAIPAPGILIDVHGYRLHIACEGYGAPTVVLDSLLEVMLWNGPQ
jgi:hypothetical protein